MYLTKWQYTVTEGLDRDLTLRGTEDSRENKTERLEIRHNRDRNR